VVWALGRQNGLAGAGDERARSALDFRPPPAIPLYNGTAWFLPAVFAWLTLQDRLSHRRRGRGSQ
jgi:hypothetical protein